MIAQLQADRSQKTGITAARIVEELVSIVFHRITDVMLVKVGIATVRDTEAWEPESYAAVSEIQGECLEGESVTAKLKVKTYDKMRALEMLAKIMGLLGDFDAAIATLKNYGLELKRDGVTGKYYVAD